MNKLEVLYKVVSTMKDKEEFKGEGKLKVSEANGQGMDISNKFNKNIAKGIANIDLKADINYEDFKVNAEVKKELDLNKMKEMKRMAHGHHGMHGHGCHGGMKGKLSHIAFVLKRLNDIEVEANGEGHLIKVDLKAAMKDMKAFKEERMQEFKAACENGQIQLTEEQKAHHDMMMMHKKCMKKIFCGNYDEAKLNVYVNKNFEVEKLEAKGTGDKNFDISLVLNW